MGRGEIEAGADVAELLVDAEALLLLVVAFLARLYVQGVDSKKNSGYHE